jgi:hypothetical protein
MHIIEAKVIRGKAPNISRAFMKLIVVSLSLSQEIAKIERAFSTSPTSILPLSFAG